MPKFAVHIPEIHYWSVTVEAADEQEAFEKAGDITKHLADHGTEYSHTIWEDCEINQIEEDEPPYPHK